MTISRLYDLWMKVCTLEIVRFACFCVRNVCIFFLFIISWSHDNKSKPQKTQVEKTHFYLLLTQIVSYVFFFQCLIVSQQQPDSKHQTTGNGRFYMERWERTLWKCSCHSVQDLESKTFWLWKWHIDDMEWKKYRRIHNSVCCIDNENERESQRQ